MQVAFNKKLRNEINWCCKHSKFHQRTSSVAATLDLSTRGSGSQLLSRDFIGLYKTVTNDNTQQDDREQ
jgi:hypothetical protein